MSHVCDSECMVVARMMNSRDGSFMVNPVHVRLVKALNKLSFLTIRSGLKALSLTSEMIRMWISISPVQLLKEGAQYMLCIECLK